MVSITGKNINVWIAFAIGAVHSTVPLAYPINIMVKKLKLFVWEKVLSDYTDGIMFALAHDVEEARKMIIEKDSVVDMTGELMQEPRVIDSPEGFAVWGGG